MLKRSVFLIQEFTYVLDIRSPTVSVSQFSTSHRDIIPLKPLILLIKNRVNYPYKHNLVKNYTSTWYYYTGL